MSVRMIACDQTMEITEEEKKAYKTYINCEYFRNHPDKTPPSLENYTRSQRNLKKAREGSTFSLVGRAM